MKTITKIIIATALLFLIIGIASATDINNLKCPQGWESTGGGNYHEIGASTGSGSGRNMMIQKYADSFKDEFFTNVSADKYYVFSNGDNSFNFTDGSNQDSGCFEVVEIDNTKYFLIVSTADSAEITDGLTSYDFMLNFNKLNNFEPIAV